jgi:hypothetical protein
MAKTSKTKNRRRGSTKRVKRGGMYGLSSTVVKMRYLNEEQMSRLYYLLKSKSIYDLSIGTQEPTRNAYLGALRDAYLHLRAMSSYTPSTSNSRYHQKVSEAHKYKGYVTIFKDAVNKIYQEKYPVKNTAKVAPNQSPDTLPESNQNQNNENAQGSSLLPKTDSQV